MCTRRRSAHHLDDTNNGQVVVIGPALELELEVGLLLVEVLLDKPSLEGRVKLSTHDRSERGQKRPQQRRFARARCSMEVQAELRGRLERCAQMESARAVEQARAEPVSERRAKRRCRPLLRVIAVGQL